MADRPARQPERNDARAIPSTNHSPDRPLRQRSSPHAPPARATRRAVARSFGGNRFASVRRRAGSDSSRRRRQHERQARGPGGQLQVPLARFEIELFPTHRQRLQARPSARPPPWPKDLRSSRGSTMITRAGSRPRALSRDREGGRSRQAPAARPRQHRHRPGHSTEKKPQRLRGSGHVAGGLGRDLVQGSEGKATLRKTTVESGHTKRKGLGRETLQPGQHAP